MKLIASMGLFLFLSGTALSQEFDDRLLQRYSAQELKTMQMDQPDDFSLLLYALDHATYTTAAAEGKMVNLPTITLEGDAMDFISLDLKIKDENQYFLIAGSDKMLVVKSTWVLNHERNKK